MDFRAELQKTGGNTTGFEVPQEIVDALAGGGRPKVVATVGGFSWRSSIARMGGSYWLGVSAERRTAAGISGGNTYDVSVELDTAERTVTVPDDLAAALKAAPEASAAWQRLAYSHQQRHLGYIDAAKQAETRARRVAKTIESLQS